LVTDDHGYSWHSATAISVGTVTAGTMDLPGDLDYFQFTVSQTGVYVIYSRNSIDIQAHLYDSTYSQITYDDHSGEVDNFRIERTLNPGTYFLMVKADNSVDTGDYEIWLEDSDSPIVPDSSFTVRMSNVDDLSTLYINGLELYKAKWGYSGTEPGWQYVGDQPGDSGVIDITSHLISGKNALRFTLWNEQICCTASLAIEIKRNDQTLFYDSFDIQDSSSGIKYDETFIISNGPSISQTPMTGPPGTTFIQSGAGFTPNNTVTLHFQNHLGDELPPLQLDTDAIGTFETVYDSPLDKPEGTHFWWAIDDASGAGSGKLGYQIISSAAQKIQIADGMISAILPPERVDTPFGSLHRKGDWDEAQDTFVIVHGWNISNDTSVPLWVHQMCDDITSEDSSAHGSNVFYWDWLEKAKNKLPDTNIFTDCTEWPIVPFDMTEDSGKNLAKALSQAIPPDYNKDIHLIGHSLGSLVVTYAAESSHNNELHIKDHISHLVFLDSPCHFGKPADTFLKRIKEDQIAIFVDNYWSALGKLTGYSEADTNVYLPKGGNDVPLWGHSYSYKWYRSSVTNFSYPEILGDENAPVATQPWGFYWWNQANRTNLSPYYLQSPSEPHWLLIPFDSPLTVISGELEDAAQYTGEIAEKSWNWMSDFVEHSEKKVKLLAVNTYNAAIDTAGYVTDSFDHAFQELSECQGIICGSLRLEHHSASIVTTTLDVPEGANGMAFGFSFQYAEPGSVLEVFIGDLPVFHAFSHDVIDEGYQMIPWIDVSQHAGDSMTLTFRLSNPIPETEGAVMIDDLIFARIESEIPGDRDGDCDADGSDLAALATDFGRTDCNGDCESDIIADGTVDENDLSVFAAGFGKENCL
jgi:hypothetical protein